jgi:hypothetical protein
MRDRVVGALLFLLVSTVYYATVLGITSSNDGSHYALIRAISVEGRFQIETYMDYTGHNDYSSRDGRFYSDRPPGTALLAVPLYLSGNIFPRPIALLSRSVANDTNPRLVYALMLPSLIGACVTVVLYYLLRFYRLSEFASLTTSLAFAFGTIYWKYGSQMFSHVLSGLLVLGSFALAVRSVRSKQLHWPTALLLGFTLGYSVVVEYSNAILLVVILVYVGLGLRSSLFQGERWGAGLLALGMGIAAPIAFLMWYNIINFGGPFTTSYAYLGNPAYWRLRQFSTTFAGPLENGLAGLLWYGFDAAHVDNQGIFLLMPVTLIAIPGLWFYFRRHRSEAALVLILFVVYLLFFSKHIIFSDGTRDGRYLVPFLSLLFIPLGFALERLQQLETDSVLKTVAMFVIYGLLFLSIRNVVWHIGLSYSYTLDPGAMERTASTPSNWRYVFDSIFINWRNVPLLWMVETIGATAIFGATRVVRYMTARHASPGEAETLSSV